LKADSHVEFVNRYVHVQMLGCVARKARFCTACWLADSGKICKERGWLFLNKVHGIKLIFLKQNQILRRREK